MGWKAEEWEAQLSSVPWAIGRVPAAEDKSMARHCEGARVGEPQPHERSPAGAVLFSEVVVLVVLPVCTSTFCHGLLDAVMVRSYPWG